MNPRFKCLNCGHEFDCFQTEDCRVGKTPCPRCGSIELEQLHTLFGADEGDITSEEYLNALPYSSL